MQGARRTGWAVVVLAMVAGLVLLGGPARAEGLHEAHGLRLVTDEVVSDDGRLHELTLDSDALGRPTQVRVLLPDDYDAGRGKRYPVLFLLHGANDDERSWTRSSAIAAHTADLDLIVVLPDGGRDGFYTDWLDGPAWETHHIGELVPWVDARYRTVGTREGRAVAGLSMGGFGSMSYASRHPDLFAAAASFSGGVDIADLGVAEAVALEALGLANDRKWGPFVTHEAQWRGHNPADLAPNLRSTHVHLTSGNGVPCPGDRPESGVTEAATGLMLVGYASRLRVAGVEHHAELRPCGTHEWRHWDAALAGWLPHLMATFAAPPARPTAFDHRTTEPVTSVWGWTFTAHRPAIELLELQGVSASGLTATGSGLVDVVTAAAYEPGATYTVASDRAGVVTVPVALVPPLGAVPEGEPQQAVQTVAGPDGRLRFTLDLGPAHVPNQYSPGGIVHELIAVGRYFRTASVAIAPA